MNTAEMVETLARLCRTLNSKIPITGYHQIREFSGALDAACMLLPNAVPLDPPPNTVRARIAVAVGDGEGDAVLLDPGDEHENIIRGIIENFSGGVIATAVIEADIPMLPTVQARVVEVPNA